MPDAEKSDPATETLAMVTAAVPVDESVIDWVAV